MLQDIPADYQQVLNQLVARGNFREREDALRHALDLLVDEQERATAAESDGNKLSLDDWQSRLQAFLSDVQSTNPSVDSSRESIYGERLIRINPELSESLRGIDWKQLSWESRSTGEQSRCRST